MNEKNNQFPECSYGTGGTHPVKSRGGLLAVVLAVVIALGGIFNLMNMLNIRLFRKIEDAPAAITFSRQISAETSTQRIGNTAPRLGIRGETVSSYLQGYYHLPRGVYVTQVIPGGAAQKAGLTVGDVIVTFAGADVETVSQLAELIRAKEVGAPVQLTVSRAGTHYPITLILGEN